jgi:hypothetical protein
MPSIPNMMRRLISPSIAIGLSVTLTIFGLWTSLEYTLTSWGTDADVANNVM